MPGPAPLAGTVAPYAALLLLQTLRDADTPADGTDHHREDDLPLNLRRRLGLSSVVEEQIRRYADRPARDAISAEEVASLLRLIDRRPDARTIFREAGRRLAGRALGERRLLARLGARALPEGLRRRLALRRVRGLATAINPTATVDSGAAPVVLEVVGSLPARALENPDGCALLTGAMETVLGRYLGTRVRVRHPRCEATDDDRCRWTAEDRPAAPTEAAEGA